MRIGIAGKGGTGKTTLCALLSWNLKDLGKQVLAVDADPDTNLASILGFPEPEKIVPIVRMKELISERMEVRGGFFKLNPQISDIPEKFMQEYRGIKLIVMGTVESGGSGCVCPESTFLKRLLREIILRKDEFILVDFEAGVEHLGRGIAREFDFLLIVVEPSQLSLESFKRISPLAEQLGVKRIFAVANKLKDGRERDFLLRNLGKEKIFGFLSYSQVFSQVNTSGNYEILREDKLYKEVKELAEKLLSD
ncbi:MAG: AAA family ATPase [Candidatus Omnitrophica bacterium]|nr:AAA family ATPase [Candidatus Omnitrophota bacterium]MCM8793244.1 AAA family ATPase [Candidatus Omnitrophota bacterium]